MKRNEYVINIDPDGPLLPPSTMADGPMADRIVECLNEQDAPLVPPSTKEAKNAQDRDA